MSVYGRRAIDVITSISRDIGEGVPSARVERALNDAVLRVAEEAEAFRRHELISVVQNTAEYGLKGEAKRIMRVWWDGKRILQKSQDLLDSEDAEWRVQYGHPSAWTGERRVRLTPIPDASGAAFTIPGDGAISAVEGHRITGADYWLIDKASADLFFLPGDGNVTNPEAAGNLLVEYSYYPDSIDATTIIPYRFVGALQDLVVSMIAPDAAQKAAAVEGYKTKIQSIAAVGSTASSRVTELLPGDPTGKELSIPREVLVRALSEAVASGKPVTKEVLVALQRDYVHDLDVYQGEMLTALPWAFVQDEVQRCVREGLPISARLMQAFQTLQPIVDAGGDERPLFGEAFWVSPSRGVRATYDGTS